MGRGLRNIHDDVEGEGHAPIQAECRRRSSAGKMRNRVGRIGWLGAQIELRFIKPQKVAKSHGFCLCFADPKTRVTYLDKSRGGIEYFGNYIGGKSPGSL